MQRCHDKLLFGTDTSFTVRLPTPVIDQNLKDILVEEESRELMEGSPEEVEEPDIILSRSRCYEQSSMFVESTL